MNRQPASPGFAGSIAGLFVRSKLTPLIVVVSLALGAFATFTTPREEDPEVTVTVADVFVAFPGRGASEVDERIARPVGASILEIPTVEHVMSAAHDDGALFVVQFEQGVERERALAQLYERMIANRSSLPTGGPEPLIIPRGADDVPVMTVSLWHDGDDAAVLRQLAAELRAELERLPDVSRIRVTGGSRREIRVELDADRLAERGLAADRVVDAVRAANIRVPAGAFGGPEGLFRVQAGVLLSSVRDVESLVVGATTAGPVYLRDVADVRDAAAEPTGHVAFFSRDDGWSAHASVTIEVYKVRGADGSDVTSTVRASVERLATEIFPDDVHWNVTRDAGSTATHRVVTLLEHMAIATLVVVLLIAIALGRREALITAIVIPVTLAVVPFVYELAGFTLNRITLSAMIFSIGILVDDAIVIIENIHRHFHQKGDAKDTVRVVIESVQEVGNPTILATFTVIAALAPTAFVSGMVGQFLRALPIGASVAMFFSLFVALTVTPYLCYRWLAPHVRTGDPEQAHSSSRIASWYRRGLAWVMARRRRTIAVEIAATVLLAGALALIGLRVATVKMLPLGDVDEMSVMIDLPPTSTLETTYAQATDAAHAIEHIPEVASCQVYVGTPGPLTFQGVGRHYMLREEPYQAELQIQLTPAAGRSRTSHDIAGEVRRVVSDALRDPQVWFTIAELPPGPPVQASLAAEVYAPDEESRLRLASHVRALLESTPGIVDVDWSARRGPPILRYEIDPQQAATRGVIAAQAAASVRTLVTGDETVWASLESAREAVPVRVQLRRSQRASESDLRSLHFTSVTGRAVAASTIGDVARVEGSFPRLRRDLQPFVSVTAEVTGPGPIYSALDLTERLREHVIDDEHDVQILWTDAPPDANAHSVRWGGEWTVTYELFRDLGAAFVVVLFLIYVMLVGWYQSFVVPIVVMLPIPLAFIGVVPGHLLFGLPISGMAVIGVIALAGLMVRNSILLVDFANEHVASGRTVKDAILLAGEVRLRPIALTAMTVVLGDGVLFFDPLLQGLGLTMAAGALVSTGLTLGLVPLAYFQLMSALEWWSSRSSKAGVM